MVLIEDFFPFLAHYFIDLFRLTVSIAENGPKTREKPKKAMNFVLESKTRFCLSILLIFSGFSACSTFEKLNPCDPESKIYLETILLKIVIGDSSLHCGVQVLPTRTIVNFSNFQNADIVIGQPDFETKTNSPVTGASLNRPGGVTVSGSTLYISDSRNHRILGYIQIPATNGATADFVIGQPDFVSFGLLNPPAANSFSFPWTVTSSEQKIFVADTANNRHLIFNSLPTANTAADIVLGVSNFTSIGGGNCSNTDLSGSEGVSIANGKLFIADEGHHRVLIWNTIPTSNYTPADIVLGQADFTSCNPNRGGSSPSANTMSTPGGVWSDGTRLFVADSYNGRVLVWNSIPTTNGQPADLVLGQPTMDSAVSTTTGSGFFVGGVYNVFSNGIQLFVGDAYNHRVLIWDSMPTVNGQAADKVLGQSNFINNFPNDDSQTGVEDVNPTARTLASPFGVYLFGKQLFVSDYENNRILIFNGK